MTRRRVCSSVKWPATSAWPAGVLGFYRLG
ncbi:hypothetical protein CIW53_09630 [Rhodanobacter sp. T12-5]|nr:hypothetical protein CIW53_09630 [Rhodanobacter sp. T12-5]